MHETRIELRSMLPVAYEQEVERRIYFASSDIVDFRLVKRDGTIDEVIVRSAAAADQGAISEKINSLIDADVAAQRLIPPRTVWTSTNRRTASGDTYPRLIEQGLAAEAGEGQVILAQPLIRLFEYLDARLRKIAVERFKAREYQYPTLIRARTLETCGYFSSFPQYLMFVTRLHSDVDTYREFHESYRRSGRLPESVLSLCDGVDYCLPPTMCFHTFGQHRAATVDIDHGGVVVTSRGKSFRFESRYAISLERLWDFTIREIVFMGVHDFVLKARQEFMAAVFDLVDELGLSGHCEVANDPFFCGAETAERVSAQRLMELKYELRLDIGDGRTVAAGSFNFHGDFFGKSFAIEGSGGNPVDSGCVGFGLERLAFAFVCQHGPDPAEWPSDVRSAPNDHIK